MTAARITYYRTMRSSTHIVKAIADFEGGASPDGLFRWYWDQYGGVWTVCFGHISPGDGPPEHPKDPGPFTLAQAESILARDLARGYEPPVRNAATRVNWDFNQNQFDALVCFVYNVGPGMLEHTHDLGRALETHDPQKVAAAIREYDRAANGQQLAGLTRRRAYEAHLFTTPTKSQRPTGRPHPYPGPLEPGDHGPNVRLVQAALARRGWKLTVDGDYGPATKRAVLEFKKRHHFPPDGIVGPKTWKALAP